MPISRELQVSDLGFCDRETANLGITQHSPRSKRNSFGRATVWIALVGVGTAHQPLTRPRPPDCAPPRTESWCPIGGGGLGGSSRLRSE